MVTMTKISTSLNEYLCSLKNIHISNINLNEDWGFFIDIENKKPISMPIFMNNKNKFTGTNFIKRRIKSYKSVSNLNEISDIDKEAVIFKLDEDIEEEERLKKMTTIQNNDKCVNEYKNLNYIGNICMISTIAIILFLL